MTFHDTFHPFASADGYIRIPVCRLRNIYLLHSETGVDSELAQMLHGDSIDALDAGYTEWEATMPGCPHSIAVGWDWYIDTSSGAARIAYDDIRSNVMALTVDGMDLGMLGTAHIMLSVINKLNWSAVVSSFFARTIFSHRTLQ